MQRGFMLVAAGLGLSSVGCGDAPPPQAPPAAFAPSRASAPSASPIRPKEPANAASAAPLGSSSGARASDSQAEGGLRSRFAKARALWVQQGSASYYADSLAGHSTASGTPYEPRAFTAAHRSLPFGSVLRVTRLDGGQVVYVRVNDRGPYGSRGRILDLSRAAAEALGMLRAGVVRVRVEVVEYGARKPRRRGR